MFTLKISGLTLALLCLVVLTYLLGPMAQLAAVVGLLIYGVAHMATRADRKPWMHAGLPVLLLALAVPIIAMAADAAPETVAQATGETTKITWAWGALVSQWAGALGSLVLAIAAWALRLLPAQIYAILVTARADQLIAKAIDYGVNAVKDASKDKTLEVNVGNQVLAKALQYVLDNAPGWLTTWLGGPEAIANKIWARLKLDPTASDADVAAVADRVASAQ